MTKRSRCYIAGPMSGEVSGNREAFFSAAHYMEERGDIALNPASLPAGLTEPQYMDICFAMMRAADTIVMLPGWQKSAGATAEYHYAVKIEMKVIFYSPEGL